MGKILYLKPAVGRKHFWAWVNMHVDTQLPFLAKPLGKDPLYPLGMVSQVL